jgi:hypothetical protein
MPRYLFRARHQCGDWVKVSHVSLVNEINYVLLREYQARGDEGTVVAGPGEESDE